MPKCNPAKSRECGKICLGWNRHCRANPTPKPPTVCLPKPKPKPKPKPTTIQVPIFVQIVKDVTIVSKSITMENWIKCSEVERLIAEVNEIWEAAGVTFTVIGCREANSPKRNDKEELASYIGRSGRTNQMDNRNRKKAIDALLPPTATTARNVYLFPFTGSRRQGHANFGKGVVIGVWSDKYSPKPEKRQMVEPQPFKKGSLAQTTAHELGHVLGLVHPVRKESTRHLLMASTGYSFSDKEINVARNYALKLET